MIGIERSNQRTKRATRNVKAGLSMMTSACGRRVSTARTTRAIWLDNPRQPARNGGKADDRKVVHRQQADEAGRGHLAAADAREPQRFAGALPQRAHQRGAKPVAGFLGSDQENLQFAGRLVRTPGRRDGHRSVPSALTPMTKILARSAAAAMRSGSATSVEPATTATPARPAPAAASTVGGPITGRSMRWS